MCIIFIRRSVSNQQSAISFCAVPVSAYILSMASPSPSPTASTPVSPSIVVMVSSPTGTVGTGDTTSEVLHALPATRIYQVIGNEQRLIAEGELQVLLHRGEGLTRDTALLYLGSFTVAIRKGMWIVREGRTYALSFDGSIYRIVISPNVDEAVFHAFDLQVAAEADLSVRTPTPATPSATAPAPKKSSILLHALPS